MATDSDKNLATLKTYVNDMLTLQKHILEATEQQAANANVKSEAQTIELVSKVRHTVAHRSRILKNRSFGSAAR